MLADAEDGGKPMSRKLSKYQMESGANRKLFRTKKSFQLLSPRVSQFLYESLAGRAIENGKWSYRLFISISINELYFNK